MEVMNNVIKAKESFQKLQLHKSIREDYKSKKFISFVVVWSFGSFMFYQKVMTAAEWIGFSEWLLGIFFFFNAVEKRLGLGGSISDILSTKKGDKNE